jgi:hypothetical protein
MRSTQTMCHGAAMAAAMGVAGAIVAAAAMGGSIAICGVVLAGEELGALAAALNVGSSIEGLISQYIC